MKPRHRNVRVWVAFLSCLSAVACVRRLDVSKVRCTQNANCPSGYGCSPSGTCISGTSGPDGSHDGAIDRAGEADGISSSSEARSGEAGPSDVPLVGSDGTATGGADNGSGGGGAGGAGGGSVGSGGVGTGGVGGVGTGGSVLGPDAGPVGTGGLPRLDGGGSGGVQATGGTPATGGISGSGGAGGACPTGQRTCEGGNTCIGIAAPACCSASECATTAAHTVATCTSNTCGTTCAPNYSPCSSSCVDLTTDNSNCGTCGAPCAGGKSCTNSTCKCPAGQGLCGGTTCVDITAPAHCSVDGITCNACTGTTSKCVSGKCVQCSNSTDCTGGRTCSNGTCSCSGTTTDCGASGCVNVNGNDNANCGSCSNVCQAGQSCSSGKCACAKGAPACGGCLAWDFEWGATPTPWSLELAPGTTTPNGATNIALTQSKPHGGSSSLIAPTLIDLVNTNIAEVTVSLPCKFNLSGYTGSAYVYLAGSYPLSDWTNQLVIDTWSSPSTSGDHVVPYFGNIPTNEWFKVDLGFQSSLPVDRIGITLTPSSNWTGTMYVDDVVINGL